MPYRHFQQRDIGVPSLQLASHVERKTLCVTKKWVTIKNFRILNEDLASPSLEGSLWGSTGSYFCINPAISQYVIGETQKMSRKDLCWKRTQRYIVQVQLAKPLFRPEQVVEVWAPTATKGVAGAIPTPVASPFVCLAFLFLFTNRASQFLLLNLQCATWTQQWGQAIEWPCWQHRSHRKTWSSLKSHGSTKAAGGLSELFDFFLALHFGWCSNALFGKKEGAKDKANRF